MKPNQRAKKIAAILYDTAGRTNIDEKLMYTLFNIAFCFFIFFMGSFCI